ncbi:MAG: HEAT repeat domain-containing protein [Candidatus Odinarchaeota archaeon]
MLDTSKPDREQIDKVIKDQLAIIECGEGESVQQAIEILAGVDDPGIIDHLIKILDNKTIETQIAVIRELGRLGGKKAVKALEKVLKGEYERTDVAGDYLVRIFTENALDTVTLAKITAVEALKETGEATAVEPLIDAVFDGSPDVKAAAATALMELVEKLTEALEKGEGNQTEILEAARKIEERSEELERAMESLQEKQVEIEKTPKEKDGFEILRQVNSVLDEIDDLEVLEEMIKRLIK